MNRSNSKNADDKLEGRFAKLGTTQKQIRTSGSRLINENDHEEFCRQSCLHSNNLT